MIKAARRPSLLSRRNRGERPKGAHAFDSSQHFLEALGRELLALGVNSELITSGSRPRLQLGRWYGCWNADSSFEDHVLAAPVPGAGWSYWWPTIEMIGSAAEPVQAAQIIADQLVSYDLGVGAPLPDWRFL